MDIELDAVESAELEELAVLELEELDELEELELDELEELSCDVVVVSGFEESKNPLGIRKTKTTTAAAMRMTMIATSIAIKGPLPFFPVCWL